MSQAPWPAGVLFADCLVWMCSLLAGNKAPAGRLADVVAPGVADRGCPVA
jgi:hypothetical protein